MSRAADAVMAFVCSALAQLGIEAGTEIAKRIRGKQEQEQEQEKKGRRKRKRRPR